MTAPAAAPAALHPSDPILHRSCSMAIGDSVAMNESTERFERLSDMPRLGRAKTF